MTSNAPHLSDELLSARLDDHLAAAERQHVDAHLATCDACASRYAGLRATQAALRSLRAVPLPRDFRLDVAAPVGSAPRSLTPMRNAGFARLLSAAALICGLLFLAIGLFTFTVVDNTTAHMAASSNAAAAVAPQSPTGCAISARCPSVNAGYGGAPTITPVYGSEATASPANNPTPASGHSFSTAQTPSTGSHNTTPSLLIVGFGIVTTLVGAVGLWRWGRPYPPTPSSF